MKTIFFVLIVVFGGTVTTFAEDVFPLENAEWIEEESLPLEGMNFYYRCFLDGDTIIDGIKRSKLYMNYLDDPDNILLAGTIHIEGKKVYFRNINIMGAYYPCVKQNETLLLYDFGLVAGDEVEWCGHEKFKIDKVDMFPLGDISRRRFVFNDSFVSEYCIEGMGNTWGVLSPISEIPIGSRNIKVIYFKQNGQILYQDPSVSVEDAELNNLFIFPNPANNLVEIVSSKEIAIVRVYTLEGLLVQEAIGNGTLRITLDISNMHSGNYLIKVSFQDGIENTRKLLVN